MKSKHHARPTQGRTFGSHLITLRSKKSERNEPQLDKTNKVTVRPAKTRISLGIHPVWSDSSLCAQWVAKNPSFLHVDSEDSVFAGHTATLLVLSCHGSNQVVFNGVRNACHLPENGKSSCILFFFNHRTSTNVFVSWTVRNTVLKSLCNETLQWLKFCFGEIIGSIYGLALKYCQI